MAEREPGQMPEEESKIDKDKEKISIPEDKTIIFEIGPGESPFFSQSGKEVKENEFYIGVDLDPEVLKRDQENFGQENIHFIQAEGEKLPLPDNSADIIVARNYFGQSSNIPEEGSLEWAIFYLTKSRFQPTWKDRELGFESFLEEARRVLKSKGELVIIEQYTPIKFDSMVGRLNSEKKETFEQQLNRFGFRFWKISARVRKGKDWTSQYLSPDNFWRSDPDSYIAIFDLHK
ncbi:MAG: class I SAM-dependent methyltransferase [Patescibacteria group bacterium]